LSKIIFQFLFRMNISEKIARIRRQPEHVRLRYVWGCVAVSMFIVLAIWIFSISAMFRAQKNTPTQEGGASDIAKQLQDLKQQAPSLGDFTAEPLTVNGEGVAGGSGSADFQYPATAVEAEIPKASSYDELSAAGAMQ
jgi:hypothetical protein